MKKLLLIIATLCITNTIHTMKRNNPCTHEEDSIFPKVYDARKARSSTLITPNNIEYIQQRSNNTITIKTKKGPSSQHLHLVRAVKKSAFTKLVKSSANRPANTSANRRRGLLQRPQNNHDKMLFITTHIVPITQRSNHAGNQFPVLEIRILMETDNQK